MARPSLKATGGTVHKKRHKKD